jgi:hypothetical protein
VLVPRPRERVVLAADEQLARLRLPVVRDAREVVGAPMAVASWKVVVPPAVVTVTCASWAPAGASARTKFDDSTSTDLARTPPHDTEVLRSKPRPLIPGVLSQNLTARIRPPPPVVGTRTRRHRR